MLAVPWRVRIGSAGAVLKARTGKTEIRVEVGC